MIPEDEFQSRQIKQFEEWVLNVAPEIEDMLEKHPPDEKGLIRYQNEFLDSCWCAWFTAAAKERNFVAEEIKARDQEIKESFQAVFKEFTTTQQLRFLEDE